MTARRRSSLTRSSSDRAARVDPFAISPAACDTSAIERALLVRVQSSSLWPIVTSTELPLTPAGGGASHFVAESSSIASPYRLSASAISPAASVTSLQSLKAACAAARCGRASPERPSCQNSSPASPRAIGVPNCASARAASSRLPSRASPTALANGPRSAPTWRAAAMSPCRSRMLLYSALRGMARCGSRVRSSSAAVRSVTRSPIVLATSRRSRVTMLFCGATALARSSVTLASG